MALAVVEELKAALHDQPANPLRPPQVREYQDELVRLGAMAAGRDMDGVAQQWIPGDRAAASRRARQIKETLAAQAPKLITGDRANVVHAKVKEVIETVIKPGLLPRSVMRRNPPGTVGHILRNEFHPAFKAAVLEVKRGLRALDPDNADPDFTNIERFRPEGLGDGTSSFMATAQIPGLHAMSQQAKDHWPLGDATADTAIAQARRQEQAETGRSHGHGQRRAKVARPKRVVSEEQRQAFKDRMQRARDAKRAQATQGTEAATGTDG